LDKNLRRDVINHGFNKRIYKSKHLARLERMVKLKDYIGVNYNKFCKDFLNLISDEEHASNGCVKFYVGIKKY
jgi:hypothetical protein